MISKLGVFLKKISRNIDFKNLIETNQEITVEGIKFTNLIPLGGSVQPGITKASQLSFCATTEKGKKVKIYSNFSERQVKLRLEFQNLNFSGVVFPDIIASNNILVVEEWVNGEAVSSLNNDSEKDKISAFLSDLQNRRELLELAEKYTHSFCYFEDYLIKRLGPWMHIDSIRVFTESWYALYAEAKKEIPIRISHADLSATNIIKNKNGDLVVIDNELLGVGLGHVLDVKNSFLNNEFKSLNYNDFVSKSWTLRRLGSALDSNRFDMAFDLIKMER